MVKGEERLIDYSKLRCLHLRCSALGTALFVPSKLIVLYVIWAPILCVCVDVFLVEVDACLPSSQASRTKPQRKLCGGDQGTEDVSERERETQRIKFVRHMKVKQLTLYIGSNVPLFGTVYLSLF